MLGVKSYLDFVRYCIGEQQCVPTITDWLCQAKGWNALFLFMQQQALVGVGFYGLEKMKAAGVDVPREVVLRWYAMSEQIRQRNVEMNKKCVELTEILRKDGFDSCILKGQGNAMMYPDPLSRQPGDIDVWINGERNVIVEYVKNKYKEVDVEYHHVGVVTENDVDVEFHFVPGYMQHPFYNKRLQNYFQRERTRQMAHHVLLPGTEKEIAVPTWDFNVVQQLEHIKNHYICGGIGLRQMMDYYYLLRKVQGSRFKVQGSTKSLEETLKYLNLHEFAGAVMWVLHEVFGLEKDYYLASPDEWRGKALLKGILNGGNFGQHAEFFKRRQVSKNHAKRFMIFTANSYRHFDEYPSDVFFDTIFRFTNYFRKQLNNKE